MDFDESGLSRSRLDSDDPEEIAAFVGEVLGARHVVPSRRERMSLAGTAARPHADFTVWRATSASGVSLALSGQGSPRIAVWLPLEGTIRVEHGSDPLIGSSARLIVGPVETTASITFDPGHDGICLALSGGYLDRRSTRSADGAGDTEPKSISAPLLVDATSALGQALGGYGCLIWRVFASDNAARGDPTYVARHLDAFTGLLSAALASPAATGADEQRGAGSLAHVERAEAFMRTHAKRPIGVRDLAVAAGVSVRTLQYAFERFRSSTPLAALNRIRLEGARAELAARPDARVADIAMAWGFTHLGRFSARYQQSFGERPSQTQARARG